MAIASGDSAALWKLRDGFLEVLDVKCLPIHHSSPTQGALGGHRLADSEGRDRYVVGDETKDIAVGAKDGGVHRFAEPRGTLGHGV